MKTWIGFFGFLSLLLVSMSLKAQQADTLLFVNDGDKIIYHVSRDAKAQQGTVSDALQNVPGVKVDTEGNISLRGVSNVVVWINDQPSHFEDESQKNYLQQTQAAHVVRIEVMTNPSARYTVETDTGIINIITDNNGKRNSMLSVGIQANTSPDFSPWIAYVWENEKLSFNANLKGTFSRTNSITDSWSVAFDSISLGNGTSVWDTSRYHRNKDFGRNSQNMGEVFLKLDYRANAKNTLSAFFTLTPMLTYQSSTDSTFRHEYLHDVGSYRYTTQTDGYNKMFFGSAGVMYQHRFKRDGEQFSFHLSSDFDVGETKTDVVRIYQEQSNLNRDVSSQNHFKEAGWNAKAEYVLPYSKKGELYFSLSNGFKPDNNICLYDSLDFATGERRIDSVRSEQRDFSKYTTSGLVILQQRWGNFTFKPGIELEHVFVKAEYFNFYPDGNLQRSFLFPKPSLHLSYRTGSQHNFSLSYTRKTTYPDIRQLTSHLIYEEDDIVGGNPDLKPTLTDVFEGGWAKYWDRFGSVSVNLYYKNYLNTINQLSELRYDPLWGRAVYFTWPVNIDTYNETGTQVNFTYRPSATLNIRFDGNFYQSHLATMVDDTLVSYRENAYNLRLAFWGKLWNKLEIHATAYYNSPTFSLWASSQTAYGINCGLRADFFDNRLSLLLNANDIFNWNKEDNYFYSPYYISYSSYRYNSRYVSIEAIYRIGL